MSELKKSVDAYLNFQKNMNSVLGNEKTLDCDQKVKLYGYYYKMLEVYVENFVKYIDELEYSVFYKFLQYWQKEDIGFSFKLSSDKQHIELTVKSSDSRSTVTSYVVYDRDNKNMNSKILKSIKISNKDFYERIVKDIPYNKIILNALIVK